MFTDGTFWAMTCESGKIYSRALPERFHLTMAALEPRDPIPENKQVSLIIEHKDREFLLCTLDYCKAMQVPLNLKFSKQEFYFFVTGEGTVHLSGYCIVDKEIEEKNVCNDMFNDFGTSELTEATVEGETEETQDEEEEEEEEGYDEEEGEDYYDEEDDEDDEEEGEDGYDEEDDDEEEEEEDVGTNRLFQMYDTEEEDSEDWTSEKKKQLNARLLHKKKREVLSSGESDQQSEDDYVEEGKKRKKLLTKTPKAKRSICHRAAVKTNKDTGSSSSKKHAYHPYKTLDYSAVFKPVMSSTPLGKSTKKKNKQKSRHKQPVTKARRDVVCLPSGAQYKDIEVGKGAVARLGKFVSTIHAGYIEKPRNGQVFEYVKGNKPYTFRLGTRNVFPAWNEGIEGMRVGGTRMLQLPPNVRFGRPGVPKNSILNFTIHLVAVT